MSSLGELSFEPYNEVKNLFERPFSELMIVSPFISQAGLKSILDLISNPSEKSISVITRWRKADVISGASDIKIYPVLRALGSAMFHHEYIHLKCYVLDKRWCLFGSANLTQAGLNIGEGRGNIEVCASCELTPEQYSFLEGLLSSSACVPITDKYYEEMRQIISDHEDLRNEWKSLSKKYDKKVRQFEKLVEFLKPAHNKDEILNEFMRRYR